MNPAILLAIIAIPVRFASLFVSIRNEKRLKAAGAVEHGVANTKVLAVMHVLFYLAALAEAYFTPPQNALLSCVGGLLWIAAMLVLMLVIRTLGPIWTVKLIIAPHHVVVRNGLFSLVRHPNYFLNIVPELVGIAVLLQAWYVLAIGLPLYLIPLSIRIAQEERVMKASFNDY